MLHNVSHLSNKTHLCGMSGVLCRHSLRTLSCPRKLPLLRDGQLQGRRILHHSTATNHNPPPTARIGPPAWRSLEVAEETIYAVSTAPGRAGIAIVRISGPACLEVSGQQQVTGHDINLRHHRYMEVYAHRNRSPSPDMPPFERSTIRRRLLETFWIQIR